MRSWNQGGRVMVIGISFLLVIVVSLVVARVVGLLGTPPPTRRQHHPPPDTGGQASEAPEEQVEYVIPVKSSPPIKDHDLLYTVNPEDTPTMRHHSGHFRQKMATVWDPHPQYEFTAFGKTFHLDLAHGHNFVRPNLKVTHVWENRTTEEDPGLRTDGCFYTGTVRGDPNSAVVVNLCHGMRGHIRTSNGSFFIQPAEPWKDHNTPIKHAVTRAPSPPSFRPCLHEEDAEYDDLEEPEEEEEVNGTKEEGSRRQKRSFLWSHEYFIEIMVVADRQMAEFHGDGLNEYILTLMSIVAMIYKDASIGNPISVAVVKVQVLNDSDQVLELGRLGTSSGGIDASRMLNNFCGLQHRWNQHDDRHPLHHDTALLITREKICRNPFKKECETLGLAEVGRMCDSYLSCSLVRDNGLSAAFTIAHELGHILSMPHDDDPKKCGMFLAQKSEHLVMSRMLDHHTKPWSWSTCSRHYLTEYLETGKASCLEDRPQKDLSDEVDKSKLPGEGFSVDRQCELVYNRGSVVCPEKPPCKKLWCTNINGRWDGCTTRHMPWADGTPCGQGKWCQRAECVPRNNNIRTPVHGGWGPWQNYGECSRTCGGGVKKAVRKCDNPSPANGGQYCIGNRVKYKSCSTRECPPGTTDFREMQCSEHNHSTFNISNLTKDKAIWVPKYGGISSADKCVLFCRLVHSTDYYPLREKVVDGTVCRPDTFDICVNGVCHAAGCDHVLNSTTQLDYCGVCGGDNSTCKRVNGQYDTSDSGYREVVRIPAGSTNIDIRQHSYLGSTQDNNYLALVNSETGDYLLNGHYIVSGFRKVVFYGGVPLEYSGSDVVIERINSSRPLTKDLIVQVLSVGETYPPNIVFQYAIKNEEFHYEWVLTDEWSPCDKICQGESNLVGEYRCIKTVTGEEVSPEMCKSLDRPERPPPRSCNSGCTISWEVASQSNCSSGCGRGTMKVMYHCVRRQASYDLEAHMQFQSHAHVLDHTFCQHLTQPNSTVDCEGSCNNFSWVFTEWTPCSTSCGPGMQSRSAHCVDHDHRPRSYNECKKMELVLQRECKQQECPYWQEGEWTACTVTCGVGEQMRLYRCQLGDMPTVPSYCPQDRKPVTIKNCTMGPCPQWITNEWSQCSKSCGTGEMTRRVECSVAGSCSNESRPTSKRSCQIITHCTFNNDQNDIPDINSVYYHRFVWKYGAWTKCSRTCGKGEIRRNVQCVTKTGETVVNKSFCRRQRKPKEVKDCKLMTCPFEWVQGDWSQCSVSCGGQGVQTRDVHCVRSRGEHVNSRYCDPATMPLTHRNCTNQPPCNHHYPHYPEYRWKTGEWQPCTNPCTKRSQQVRKLFCYRGHKKVRKMLCPKETKPRRKQKCPHHNCPSSCVALQQNLGVRKDGEYILHIGRQSVSIYCSHMNTPNPKDFITLHATDNYAEIYDKRLINAGTCPHNGQRSEYCYCVKYNDKNVGYTTFSKIRINTTSLIVDAKDFTFAKALKGSWVAYGEAGDCYSSANCPQGQFSINLAKTGFRVSRNTHWFHYGNSAFSRINTTDHNTRVVGRCGGYCGTCRPKTELSVEVLPL